MDSSRSSSGFGEPVRRRRRAAGSGSATGGPRRGHQPALHGLDERGARGEREGAAEEAAARQHQVAAGELADQRHRLRARPRQVDAGHGGRLVRGAQAEVLDGDDAAEALGEQLGQDPRDRLARLLAVEPAAHPRGVRADVVGAQLPCPAVHLARQLALGPAAAHEPRAQLLIGALLSVRHASVAAAHWNAPIPEATSSPPRCCGVRCASSPTSMPSTTAARPVVVTPRTGNRLACGIPKSAYAPGARVLKVILRSPLRPWRTRKRHHSPPLRMN